MSQMAPGIPLSPEGRVTTAERLVLEELRAIRTAVEALVALQTPSVVHTYTAPPAVTEIAPGALERLEQASIPQRPRGRK